MKRQGFDTQPSHYRGDLLRSYAQVVFSLLHRAAGGGCAGAGAVAEAMVNRQLWNSAEKTEWSRKETKSGSCIEVNVYRAQAPVGST